jgi:hypothetical protein
MPEKKTEEKIALVVHRKATWCTFIGAHKFVPGYNKIEGTTNEIESIKKTSAWETETQPNPMYAGRANMVEVEVEETAKKNFVDTIKEMKAPEAMELISHHGDIEDVRSVLQNDDRKSVKEAAKNQIEEIESRDQ